MHEFAASRDAVADGGEILKSSRARRPGSGRAGGAPRSDSEDAADGPQWRSKPEASSPRLLQGVSSSHAQNANVSGVVQIKLVDRLPQMASAVPPLVPSQALQSQSSMPQMPDGYQWGYDPQDIPMNWLPPPAEDQVWPAWPPCDASAANMMSAWSPPADFFETPQKLQTRLPDEWTPPKPEYPVGLPEFMPQELWWEQPRMDCATHGYPVPSAHTDIPLVPPLPVGSGTNSPPSTPRTPRQNKTINPAASPTLKTPNSRAHVRVPRSAGGQTSLPATPHGPWMQDTPSPKRHYLTQPMNLPPFGELPSVVPMPQTAPWS